MTIVIGVDDSPHAHAAVDLVRRQQWPEGTRVVVVSAARPVVSAYAEVYASGAGYSEQLYEEQVRHCETLAREAAELLREGGMTAEGRVVRGDAREALVSTARELKADLLVVGSHGRHGLAKLLIGSVASHVVTHAPCNVLVVKLPA